MLEVSEPVLQEMEQGEEASKDIVVGHPPTAYHTVVGRNLTKNDALHGKEWRLNNRSTVEQRQQQQEKMLLPT